jgi:integrase
MSGSGTIRQRSPGSFEIRYQVGRKTKTETFRGGKREAEKRLRALLSLVDKNLHPYDPDRLTVAGWLQRWLGIIEPEVAKQTHANYEAMVRSWIEPALGSFQLARLSPADLQGFYTTIAASRLRPSSAAHACIVLNIALSRAVELRLIVTHPGKAVRKRKPRAAAPTADRPVLDRDQCTTLLAAARATDLYVLVLTGLATGARRSEILALRWDDVDFDAGEINIRESIVRLRGVTTRETPKNGKSRVVTIPDPIVAELRRIKRVQAEELLRVGVRQDGTTEVCRRGADGTIRSPLSVTNAFLRLVQAGRPARCDVSHSSAHACDRAAPSWGPGQCRRRPARPQRRRNATAEDLRAHY